jgi:Emfourin
MKINFEQKGGILGVNNNISINTDYLNPDEAFKLRQLIDNAKFFELPTHSLERPQRGADYFEYKITIEGRDRKHHVKTTDITMPPNLGPLIRYLRKKVLEKKDERL